MQQTSKSVIRTAYEMSLSASHLDYACDPKFYFIPFSNIPILHFLSECLLHAANFSSSKPSPSLNSWSPGYKRVHPNISSLNHRLHKQLTPNTEPYIPFSINNLPAPLPFVNNRLSIPYSSSNPPPPFTNPWLKPLFRNSPHLALLPNGRL